MQTNFSFACVKALPIQDRSLFPSSEENRSGEGGGDHDLVLATTSIRKAEFSLCRDFQGCLVLTEAALCSPTSGEACQTTAMWGRDGELYGNMPEAGVGRCSGSR